MKSLNFWSALLNRYRAAAGRACRTTAWGPHWIRFLDAIDRVLGEWFVTIERRFGERTCSKAAVMAATAPLVLLGVGVYFYATLGGAMALYATRGAIPMPAASSREEGPKTEDLMDPSEFSSRDA